MIPFDFTPEIEESDRVITTLERTRLPEWTQAQKDEWNAMQAADRARREKEALPDEPIKILQPSKPLPDPLRAPGAAGLLAKRLAGGGWEVSASQSRSAVPATLYASDSEEGAKMPYRKGDVRFAAHELESVTVIGTKRDASGKIRMVVDAHWTRKVGGNFTFQGAKTFDPVLGLQWRPTVKTERKPREWEIEEGVTPPWGLNQWISVVCPEPKKEEK